MSYEDEVGKRADQLAADEWDDQGKIAKNWQREAIMYEGSVSAYTFALELYYAALTGNSVGAELDQLRDQFIEEVSDRIFYPIAEQQIREEQQDAADALKEEYYDARREEAREAGIRG